MEGKKENMTPIQSNASAPQGDQSVPIFPSQVFPTVTRHARLLGIYPQRQPGQYMHRVRIPGGILSGSQWLALADIARQFTPRTPLHLTTRQDIELHELSEADIPNVEQALAKAGLTSLGSGGDTLRNIIVCPCCAGGSADTPDLMPLAQAISETLAAYEGLFTLPRKFKISLACDRGCGRPFAHDLALTAVRSGDGWALRVVLAGSLGAKPATGIALAQTIEPGEAPALSLAAMRMFDELGDRQNRTKARLRHVRQRLGDEATLAELKQRFQSALAERAWPSIRLATSALGENARCVLTFANGDVTPAAAQALAELAQVAGLSVRIGNDHRIEVFGTDAIVLHRELTRHESLRLAAAPQASVIACPGARWCSRALADTNGLADRIRAALAGKVDGDVMIAASGCPNGCAGSAVADVGITGGRSTSGEQVVEKYTVFAGGGRGATDVMAQVVATGLSADEVVAKAVGLLWPTRPRNE